MKGGLLVTRDKSEFDNARLDSRGYHRTKMQKESIIQKLKGRGCRITKQRLMLLDIILNEECSCCKEIYYRAVKFDSNIGSATVYRMINLLEEIGAITRNNMYKIACGEECHVDEACHIELSNHEMVILSGSNWNKVIREGLKACGYIDTAEVKNVTVRSCDCA